MIMLSVVPALPKERYWCAGDIADEIPATANLRNWWLQPIENARTSSENKKAAVELPMHSWPANYGNRISLETHFHPLNQSQIYEGYLEKSHAYWFLRQKDKMVFLIFLAISRMIKINKIFDSWTSYLPKRRTLSFTANEILKCQNSRPAIQFYVMLWRMPTCWKLPLLISAHVIIWLKKAEAQISWRQRMVAQKILAMQKRTYIWYREKLLSYCSCPASSTFASDSQISSDQKPIVRHTVCLWPHMNKKPLRLT